MSILDAQVAEKVMGLNNDINPPCSITGKKYPAFEYSPYSTDISAAWRVVEKMKDKGFALSLISGIASGYDVACFYNARDQRFIADRDSGSKSVPHAICLAALKAVQGTSKDG